MFFDRFEDLCKQKGVSKQRACIDCGLSRTEEGERKVSDDDIKFALWGTREIDDDVLDRVRQFAKFAQENEKNK